MSRKRGEESADSRDVFDVETLGLGDIRLGYVGPNEARATWGLPDNEQIIWDFERCGSQLDIFLKAIAPDDGRFSRQLLLAAIVLQLKGDKASLEKFQDLRNAGEDARLMLLEERAFAMAEYDPAAFKFILEKRRGDRYGKGQIDEETDEKVQALKNLSAALKANPDR